MLVIKYISGYICITIMYSVYPRNIAKKYTLEIIKKEENKVLKMQVILKKNKKNRK